MKSFLTSILVDDQEKALRFYTKMLGFQKRVMFPQIAQKPWQRQPGRVRWRTLFGSMCSYTL